MKKVLLTLPALLFAACGDKANQEATYAFLTFEHAPLYASSLKGENLYSGQNEFFFPDYVGERFTYFTDEATGLTMGINKDAGTEVWNTLQPEFYAGGIAPSKWAKTTLSAIPNTQMSDYQCGVFDTGGKGGSAGFGIVFAPNDEDHNPRPAVMEFASGVERVVHSVWVNNATYAAKWLAVNDERVSNKNNPNDLVWMEFVATGYTATGEAVGSESIMMVDYRSGKNMVTRWTQFFLHELGKVNRVELTLRSNDEMLPTYVCIDDVAVIL